MDAKLIFENGNTIDVTADHDLCYERCALVDKNVKLQKVWILELNRSNNRTDQWFDMEFMSEYMWTHEPTEDEILRVMVLAGADIKNDIGILRTGYRINRDYD